MLQKTLKETLILQVHKGQFITTEFLLVVSVLMVFIILATIIWNSTSIGIIQNTLKNELETSAIEISDQLLKSHGAPTDWEENTTKIFTLGLATKNNLLDIDKVKALMNITYSETKNSLGIKTLEFYLKLTDTLGNIIQIDNTAAEVGLKPINNSNIVNSRRIAILNNEIIYMDVIVWR